MTQEELEKLFRLAFGIDVEIHNMNDDDIRVTGNFYDTNYQKRIEDMGYKISAIEPKKENKLLVLMEKIK